AGPEAVQQLRLALPEEVPGLAGRNRASLDRLPDDEAAAGLLRARPGGAAVGGAVLADLAVPVGARSDHGPLGAHVRRGHAAEVVDQVDREVPDVRHEAAALLLAALDQAEPLLPPAGELGGHEGAVAQQADGLAALGGGPQAAA